MNLTGFLANINGIGVTYRDYYRNSVPPNTELSTFNYYYDAARVFYNIGDYLLSLGQDPTLWYTAADHAAKAYRDGYLVPASYAALGYWNFPQGLRMHWQRTGDIASKNAVISLSQTAAFSQDFATNAMVWDPDNYNPYSGGSREAAYAFDSHLDAEICGAARRTRTVQLVDVLLHHLDVFASGLAYDDTAAQQGGQYPGVKAYIRPFMVGITCEATIRGVGAGLITDSIARTKINAALDYLDTLYIAGSKTFPYTDRVASDPATDTLPAPDLNMLIAPAYAWCGRTTRAQDLFDGGVAGAWLGGGSNQKQFNQNYRWSFDLINWVGNYTTPPADVPPGEPPTTPPQNPGTVEVVVPRSACIPRIWTFGKPSLTPITSELGSGNTPGGSGSQPDPQGPASPEDPAQPSYQPLSSFGTVVLLHDFTAQSVTPLASPVDESPNAFSITQSNATYQPSLLANQINGLQVGVFDGGDGYTPSTTVMSTITKNRAGLTLYLVAKMTDFVANRQIIKAYVGSNARIDIGLNNGTGVAHVTLRPQDAGTPYDNYGSLSYQPVAGNLNLWVFKLDFAGNKLKHWLNSDVAINDVSINSTGNSDNTNITGSCQLYLNFEAGSGGLKGQVAEFGILDGAITDATFTALKNNLTLKYGVAF